MDVSNQKIPSCSPSSKEKNRVGKKKLKACLKLISGNSDEEVFAGLLMLTKHVSTEEFQRNRKTIFAAIKGINFLRKLLLSKESGAENADLYVSLSVGVSSSFCEDPECAKEFKPMFTDFQRVLAAATNKDIKENSLECLTGILISSPELQAHPLKYVSFRKLLCESKEGFSPRLIRLLDLVTLEYDDMLFLANMYENDRSDNGLVAAKTVCKNYRLQSKKTDFYCYQLQRTNDEDILRSVAGCLSKGAIAVLSSANSSPDYHHTCALHVADHLCTYVGPAWPFLPYCHKEGATSIRAHGEQNISLLLSLVSVEITVQMTRLRNGLLLWDSDKVTGSLKLHDRHTTLESVTFCLSILEHTLYFLVGMNENLASKIDPIFSWNEAGFDCLMKIRKVLLETMETIVDFLSISITTEPRGEDEEKELELLVNACSKYIGYWLQEEKDDSLDVRMRALHEISGLVLKYPQVLIHFVPILTELSGSLKAQFYGVCGAFAFNQAKLFVSSFNSNGSSHSFYYNIIDVTSFLLNSEQSGDVDFVFDLGAAKDILTSLEIDQMESSIESVAVGGALIVVLLLCLRENEYPVWVNTMGKAVLDRTKEMSRSSFRENDEFDSRIDFLENVVRPTIMIKLL